MRNVLAASLFMFLSACGSTAVLSSSPPPSGTDDAVPPDSSVPGGPCGNRKAAVDEELRVANVFGSLGGTLSVPQRCRNVPVVLVLSGTGSSDRNGNAPGGKGPSSYKMLAEALRERGIASLRFDDEGIGASATAAPKDPRDFRYPLEVDDAVLWVKKLRADARFSEVWIAGHSQGSLTALLVAQRVPIDGIVSLAGAGRPFAAAVHDQLKGRLTVEQLRQLDEALHSLEKGSLPGRLTPPLDSILPTYYQPYLASYAPYDPAAEARNLTTRFLVVQGGRDQQVTMRDAELLHAANAKSTLHVIETMAHALKEARDDDASQEVAATDPTVPLAKGLVSVVSSYISREK